MICFSSDKIMEGAKKAGIKNKGSRKVGEIESILILTYYRRIFFFGGGVVDGRGDGGDGAVEEILTDGRTDGWKAEV